MLQWFLVALSGSTLDSVTFALRELRVDQSAIYSLLVRPPSFVSGLVSALMLRLFWVLVYYHGGFLDDLAIFVPRFFPIGSATYFSRYFGRAI